MTTVGRLSYAYLNGAHECMHEIDQYMGITQIAYDRVGIKGDRMVVVSELEFGLI